MQIRLNTVAAQPLILNGQAGTTVGNTGATVGKVETEGGLDTVEITNGAGLEDTKAQQTGLGLGDFFKNVGDWFKKAGKAIGNAFVKAAQWIWYKDGKPETRIDHNDSGLDDYVDDEFQGNGVVDQWGCA